MISFDIFSDGSADIQIDAAKKMNIKTIPFYISLDKVNYRKELVEISRDEFFENLIDKKVFPKTSLPSVQDYIDAFTPSLESGKDVICFCMTDTLSGAYHSARNAAEILKEKYTSRKIHVLNTWAATGAAQLMVFEACRMRDSEFDSDKTLEICEKMKPDLRIMFMVGALTHLEHGGRIGKLTAISGGILKIKPLIELKNGEINVAGVVRSRKNGLKKLADITKEHFKKTGENPEEYNFTLGVTNTYNEIPVLRDELYNAIEKCDFKDDFLIGATIATHTGPDTIGVCFVKRYEYYL